MTEIAARPHDARIGRRRTLATKARVVNGLRWLAIAVVIAFATYQLGVHWSEFWATLGAIPLRSAVLSQLMVMASLAATVYGWRVVVDHLGTPIGYRRCAQIFLVGQLGKYVPGSVWGYLLQIELGKQAGLARSRVFVASLVHLGVVMVSAMVAGLIALPVIFDTSPNARWLLALVPIGLVALHPRVLTVGTSLVLRLLRRPALEQLLNGAMVGKALGASGAAKVLQGVHLWLLANAVGAPGWTGLALCVGAMALAMTAGTVAFVFPAGAGAREVVIVAVLVAAGIGQVEALAFAAVSRVMFLVADLVTAGGAAIAARATLRP